MSLNLSSRESRLVVLGVSALALFLTWTFILEPGLNKIGRLDESIVKHTKDLDELGRIAREMSGLKKRIEGISGRISIREKGFSLPGLVEERLAEAGLKKHLNSLQPLPPQQAKDNLTRAAVELKLKGFPMKDLVRFLHGLEYSAKPLGIPRFTLIKGRKGLEASLRVETLIKN